MAAPAPPRTQPRSVLRMLSDARDERALDGDLPPGMTDFNVARTVAFAQNPLPILIEGYRTYGPVFTIRVLHVAVVFLLGPEANHYVTVSRAQNFKSTSLRCRAVQRLRSAYRKDLGPRGLVRGMARRADRSSRTGRSADRVLSIRCRLAGRGAA